MKTKYPLFSGLKMGLPAFWSALSGIEDVESSLLWVSVSLDVNLGANQERKSLFSVSLFLFRVF